MFARYVAKEYGARGIRANTVAPGGIVTDFNNAAIRSNPKAQEWIVAQTPMGRLGEAHDIGGVVALLCSDETRWLTGQRLEVTGGFNLWEACVALPWACHAGPIREGLIVGLAATSMTVWIAAFIDFATEGTVGGGQIGNRRD